MFPSPSLPRHTSMNRLSCFWRRWLNCVTPPLLGLGSACFLGTTLSLTPPTLAAEQVTFTYGLIELSLTTQELETFIETGNLPPAWRFYFNVAGIDPEVAQAAVAKEFSVTLRFLDRTLNSLPGEYILYELGSLISTPSGRANIQSLRAALVLSARDDKISLLELIKNYPASEMQLNVAEALTVARDVGVVVRDVQDVKRRIDFWVASAQELLDGLVCNCESAQRAQSPLNSMPSPAP